MTAPTADRRLRILVADDIQDVAKAIHDVLSPDFDVDMASSGSEVLELFFQNTYDAVILDVQFPQGISGLEVAAYIREDDPDIPIMIFSAVQYSDEVRRTAVELGAVFNEKPLRREQIVNFVREGTARDAD